MPNNKNFLYEENNYNRCDIYHLPFIAECRLESIKGWISTDTPSLK